MVQKNLTFAYGFPEGNHIYRETGTFKRHLWVPFDRCTAPSLLNQKQSAVRQTMRL